MSLFNRKTRLDKAYLFNGWGIDIGPLSVGSGGIDVSNPLDPKNYHIGTSSTDKVMSQIEDNAKEFHTQAIDTSISITTMGITNTLYRDSLREEDSAMWGNMSGGAIGTSPQEEMEAEQRTADLNAFYEGYGRLRGELDKSRSQNTAISSSARGQVQARLAASGIRRGSAEWNRQLAHVSNVADTEKGLIEGQWEDYVKSSEYGKLVENYDLDWDKSYSFGGLREDEVNTLKPTFDEFYLLTRGTDEEKATMTSIFDMRKENLINKRTS